jgi:hypothetical protein
MSHIFTFSNLGHYGALGNQLFQIAGVIGEAAKVEADVYFPEWEYAPYFEVPEELFEEKSGEIVDFWPGYLQELQHFENIEVVIKDMFQPSDLAKDLIAEHYPWHEFDNRVVGVHVRRANNMYLPDHHPVPTLEYFEEALDIVPHDTILVCSDDLNWCRKQSIFKDACFGAGPPPNIDVMRLTDAHPLTTEEAVTDLFMLSMCDSHIISNSSFSWWAAWLGEGEHVIRPQRWYGPALEHIDVNVMMPDEWIAI